MRIPSAVPVALVGVLASGCGVIVTDEKEQAPHSYACKTMGTAAVLIEAGVPAEYAQGSAGVAFTEGRRLCDARAFVLEFRMTGQKSRIDAMIASMRATPAPGTIVTDSSGTRELPSPGSYTDRIVTKSLGQLDRDIELVLPADGASLPDSAVLTGELSLGG
jgi:hypothetical protein